MNPEFIAGLKLTLIELLGDTSFRNYVDTQENINLIIGYISYLYLGYTLQNSFDNNLRLGNVNAYWDGLSGLITPIIGRIKFNEQYTQEEMIGMTLVTIGLYITNRNSV